MTFWLILVAIVVVGIATSIALWLAVRANRTPEARPMPQPSPTAYCPSCRKHFPVAENPPYAVVHLSELEHRHPITREPLTHKENP